MLQTFGDRTYRFHAATGRYRWRKGDEMRTLHRDVYSATYGNIPHGWAVHHRDEDVHNNDIENLQAMPKAEHDKLGLLIDLVCEECGSDFQTKRKFTWQRYCSDKCQWTAGNRRARLRKARQ